MRRCGTQCRGAAGVVDAVAGRCRILRDSGIRSAVDVLRALTLGATGVLLNGLVLCGLEVNGVDVSSLVGLSCRPMGEGLRQSATVITTLPIFCPVSTYRWASAIRSSG